MASGECMLCNAIIIRVRLLLRRVYDDEAED